MTLDRILRLSQNGLKRALKKHLKKNGYKPKTADGYLYARGKLPVMLVAHLDTVHKKQVKTICRSDCGDVLMSPEGIGGDDRAGVYMILELIRNLNCHVLFCEDEEIGGIGAEAFAYSSIIPKVNYIIEFDRRGDNDAVFYDCDNPEFTEFIESFGFREAMGSFSDISTIAPALGIAAVNISAGFYNEHTNGEYIRLDVIRNNIKRISETINTPTKKFEYIEAVSCFTKWRYADWNMSTDWDNMKFDNCDFGKRELMMLPDDSYIYCNGELWECHEDYLMDSSGNVYKYIFDYDSAMLLGGHEAYTSNNLPVKFNEDETIVFDIITEHEVHEQEQLSFLERNAS